MSYSNNNTDFEGLILLHNSNDDRVLYTMTLDVFIQYIQDVRNGKQPDPNFNMTEIDEIAEVLFDVMNSKRIKLNGQLATDALHNFHSKSEMYSKRMQQILFGVQNFNNDTVIGFPPYPNLSNDKGFHQTRYNEKKYFCPQGVFNSNKYAEAVYNKIYLESSYAAKLNPPKIVHIPYPDNAFLSGLSPEDQQFCKNIIDTEMQKINSLNGFQHLKYSHSFQNDPKSTVSLNANAFNIAGSNFAYHNGDIAKNLNTNNCTLEEHFYYYQPNLVSIFNPQHNQKQLDYIDVLGKHLNRRRIQMPSTANPTQILPSPTFIKNNPVLDSVSELDFNYSYNSHNSISLMQKLKNNAIEDKDKLIYLYILTIKSIKNNKYEDISDIIKSSSYFTKLEAIDICDDILTNSNHLLSDAERTNLTNFKNYVNNLPINQQQVAPSHPNPQLISSPNPPSINPPSTNPSSNPSSQPLNPPSHPNPPSTNPPPINPPSSANSNPPPASANPKPQPPIASAGVAPKLNPSQPQNPQKPIISLSKVVPSDTFLKMKNFKRDNFNQINLLNDDGVIKNFQDDINPMLSLYILITRISNNGNRSAINSLTKGNLTSFYKDLVVEICDDILNSKTFSISEQDRNILLNLKKEKSQTPIVSEILPTPTKKRQQKTTHSSTKPLSSANPKSQPKTPPVASAGVPPSPKPPVNPSSQPQKAATVEEMIPSNYFQKNINHPKRSFNIISNAILNEKTSEIRDDIESIMGRNENFSLCCLIALVVKSILINDADVINDFIATAGKPYTQQILDICDDIAKNSPIDKTQTDILNNIINVAIKQQNSTKKPQPPIASQASQIMPSEDYIKDNISDKIGGKQGFVNLFNFTINKEISKIVYDIENIGNVNVNGDRLRCYLGALVVKSILINDANVINNFITKSGNSYTKEIVNICKDINSQLDQTQKNVLNNIENVAEQQLLQPSPNTPIKLHQQPSGTPKVVPANPPVYPPVEPKPQDLSDGDFDPDEYIYGEPPETKKSEPQKTPLLQVLPSDAYMQKNSISINYFNQLSFYHENQLVSFINDEGIEQDKICALYLLITRAGIKNNLPMIKDFISNSENNLSLAEEVLKICTDIVDNNNNNLSEEDSRVIDNLSIFVAEQIESQSQTFTSDDTAYTDIPLLLQKETPLSEILPSVNYSKTNFINTEFFTSLSSNSDNMELLKSIIKDADDSGKKSALYILITRAGLDNNLTDIKDFISMSGNKVFLAEESLKICKDIIDNNKNNNLSEEDAKIISNLSVFAAQQAGQMQLNPLYQQKKLSQFPKTNPNSQFPQTNPKSQFPKTNPNSQQQNQNSQFPQTNSNHKTSQFTAPNTPIFEVQNLVSKNRQQQNKPSSFAPTPIAKQQYVENNKVVNKTINKISISNFSLNDKIKVINQFSYVDKTDNTTSKKVEKRTITGNATGLHLELSTQPVNVDISFETKRGEVLTLKQTFTKILERKENLEDAKEQMQKMLSATLSTMDKVQRQQLIDGFKIDERASNVDREVANKITKQILKELNLSKKDRNLEK